MRRLAEIGTEVVQDPLFLIDGDRFPGRGGSGQAEASGGIPGRLGAGRSGLEEYAELRSVVADPGGASALRFDR